MPYEIYKFKPEEICYYTEHEVGFLEMQVLVCYTSDIYNHPAKPHRRYVVKYVVDGEVLFNDFAESELQALPR